VIPNTALIRALRSLRFSFKRQADHVVFYKQDGGTLRVGVRRNTEHDDDYARVILRQAGMAEDDIERFIREATH
jgi:hypothetical protein